MKPREQGHHLSCASTWSHQELPQQPQLDVGWRRWMGRERGRKKGLCMKYSKWAKLAGFANALKEEAALSQALGQIRRQ